MKEKEDKQLDLILNALLFAIFTITLVTLTGTIHYFYKASATLLAGFMGFVGAVIGGYLTWRGVGYNIKHQIAKDRYVKLPDEIKKCWKLNKYLSFGYFLSNLTKEKSLNETRDAIMRFYDDTEELATEISLDISPEMYKMTMKYYTLLTDYTVYVNRNEVDAFEKKMEEIYNKSSLILQAYEKEYEDLAESFRVKM